MLKTITLSALSTLVMLTAPASAEMLRKLSPHPVKETIDRLESIVKEKGLTVFARVDHAAGAKKVGLDLRPTELLIFGSPATGTPLMQAEQTMGLSLPLKVLVWQDVDNKVWLGYDTPVSVAAERGVAKDNPVLGKVSDAIGAFTDAALKP